MTRSAFDGRRVSVVTPTLHRPDEVARLLDNLCDQVHLPCEIIVVDGAEPGNHDTELVVAERSQRLPFRCQYMRHARGTAIQRNAGIDRAQGDYIAFFDDDMAFRPDYLAVIMDAFAQDDQIGGVVGYRENVAFSQGESARWRWYRRLGLLSTFEPGRYDFRCGYPINANAQPPFAGVRPVDFMTTSCAVWRRRVFDEGLRFDPFFRDYGVLEDAHFSLRAGKKWRLLQCGDAVCTDLHSARGRVGSRRIGYKSVVNYYYVFNDIAGPLTLRQKVRFWRYQCFELLRLASSAVRRCRRTDLYDVAGRIEGFLAVATGTWKHV